MDKVQKIREEVERLKGWNNNVRNSTRHMTLQEEDFNRGKHSSYLEILNFIDSLQEEPKKCMYSKYNFTNEDRKVLCDGCDAECKYSESDDFTKALAECIHQAQCNVIDPMVFAELWKDELIKLSKCEEPVSEELGEYINELSKQFPEVSFAKLSRIAVRVAKWQKAKVQESIETAIHHAYHNGKQEMKRQMIEKAIEWVEYNNKNGGCKFDGWVENIKQAMENE